MRFQDKVCLVTGGGSGIGRAACERFATEGGRVVVVDLNDEHGADVVKAIVASGGQAIFTKANVAEEAQVKSSIQAALDKWSRLDVVVNCAAMMTFKNIVDLGVEEWDRVQAVNLRSVFLYCHYALPHMNRGAIVNISSVHAHETEAGVAPYAASKGAMESFTRCVALEIASSKNRINCVAPGAVNTPMLWDNPNVKSGKERIQGAVGEPRDIAAAIAFLASDEARFITGTTLIADGGRLDIL
jgi:glucose 1-dehydrogenase